MNRKQIKKHNITISEPDFVRMLEQMEKSLKSFSGLSLTEVKLAGRIINKMERKLSEIFTRFHFARQAGTPMVLTREEGLLLLIALQYLKQDFSFLEQQVEEKDSENYQEELRQKLRLLETEIINHEEFSQTLAELENLFQAFMKQQKNMVHKQDPSLDEQERIQVLIAVKYAMEIADDMYQRLLDNQIEYFRSFQDYDAIYQAQSDNKLVIELDPAYAFHR